MIFQKAQSPGLDQVRRHVSSSGGRLFVLALPVLLFPRLLSLCCSKFDDSIDIGIEYRQYSYVCVFFFFSAIRISHRDSMYCTLSVNCLQVQIFQQRKPHLLKQTLFAGL